MAATQPSIRQLSELAPEQRAIFFALLAERTRGITAGGKPYYACRFRDARRSVSFMAWGDPENPWFEKCEKEWQAGHFYKIKAIYRENEKYGPQIEILNIRKAEERDKADGFDEANFVERTQRDVPAMFNELRTLAVKHVQDEPLRRLVTLLLDVHAEALQKLPAQRDRAYPYVGGLLEHTLNVTHAAIDLAERYALTYPNLKPALNRDLITAGAILHDVGRVAELEAETVPAGYTVAGRLLGHQVLGRDLVRGASEEVPDLNPELLSLLEHILLTHLNPSEGVGPKLALVPEALIVHHADDLDLKMEAFARCLDRDQTQGPFTDRDPVLGRAVFKGRSV